MNGAHIALVEDDELFGESLVERLELEGYRVSWFHTGAELLGQPAPLAFDLLLSDIRLPDMSGEHLYTRLASRGDTIAPTVFLTGFGSIEQAVRLLKLGAADYLTKPVEPRALLARLRELLATPVTPEPVLGVSPAMRELESMLARLAPHPEAVVLIHGESGVGKEVVARRLHALAHGQAPFVALNCAALPEQLAASELFGHERGAFTGATGRRLGAFERAGAGVLFLDEIGDMPLDLQVQLLRVIQDREFTRVGGGQTLPVTSRLICATHEDLATLVEQGAFRQDLYYRLNVVQLTVPALRERPTDIDWLADRFLAENARRVGRPSPPRLNALTRNALARYRWPGNARELKNAIDRACIFCDGETLPVELLTQPDSGSGAAETLRDTREHAERDRILQALRDNDWRIQTSARQLGISRKNLWQKMRRLDIRRESTVNH